MNSSPQEPDWLNKSFGPFAFHRWTPTAFKRLLEIWQSSEDSNYRPFNFTFRGISFKGIHIGWFDTRQKKL